MTDVYRLHFQMYFVRNMIVFFIEISLKFVPNGQIGSRSAFIQVI